MPARRRKRNNFSDELRRQIKRYNDKVRRIIKQYPELAELYQDTWKISELKKVVKTSKDLKKLTETVNRLFDKEKIKPIEIAPDVYVNQWAIGEYTGDIDIINKDRQADLKLLMKIPFKGTEFSYVQMGGALDYSLQPITKLPEDFKSGSDFSKAFKMRKSQSYEGYREYKDTLYVENFKKSIEHLGNEYYDNQGNLQSIDLVKWLDQFSPKEIVNMIRRAGEELHLLLNENYTADQVKQRLGELVQILVNE